MMSDIIRTSYYYADGQRIAMKKDGIVSYIYGDQLGSVSAVADADGNLISETLYHPWGTARYAQGTSPTDYGYTGQMREGDIYFYNARWYDPQLGCFMQADTFVPTAQGTQAWDRFAYVNNNPVRHTDPLGNYYCGLPFEYQGPPNPNNPSESHKPAKLTSPWNFSSWKEIKYDPINLFAFVLLSEEGTKLNDDKFKNDLYGVVHVVMNRHFLWNYYDYALPRRFSPADVSDIGNWYPATTNGIHGMIYEDGNGGFLTSPWINFESAKTHWSYNDNEIWRLYETAYNRAKEAYMMYMIGGPDYSRGHLFYADARGVPGNLIPFERTHFSDFPGILGECALGVDGEACR
jgi:RHS repeat-associated protein